MTSKLILLALCLILVVGCNSETQTRLPAEPTQVQMIPTATLTPKPDDTKTPTIVIPTNTDIPVRICENDGFPIERSQDLDIFGEVLLLSTDSHHLDILDLEAKITSTIYFDGNNELSAFGLSSDSNWLVYAIRTHDSNGDMNNEFTLVLLSQTGEKILRQMNLSQFEPLFYGEVFVGFGHSTWINDELIYTSLLIQNPSKYSSKSVRSIPVILNPFSGSWEEDLLLSSGGQYREAEIGISPDLQRVIVQGREIMLKDLRSGERLWSTDELFLEIPASKVRWSPNGEFVAVGKRFPNPKILLVPADGEKSETLPIGNINGFLDFEWSPNGKYIMIYHSYGDNQKNFYLYDMLKKQIVFKCPVQQPWDVLFEWSPDSSQVIYGTDEAPLLLLDIPSGKVIKFDIENMLPFGWTDKPFLH